MLQNIKSIALISLIALSSSPLFAADIFTHLKESEVQAIFDEADQLSNAIYLTNSSQTAIAAIQILPRSPQPKHLVAPATKCIKQYSCSQGICLVGISEKKYVVSEAILTKFTSPQSAVIDCQRIAKQQSNTQEPQLAIAEKAIYSWVRVVKVKADDRLNIRQTKNYKSRKMGALAPTTNCIKRYRCQGNWCEIKYRAMTGWVNKNYIAGMAKAAQPQCL